MCSRKHGWWPSGYCGRNPCQVFFFYSTGSRGQQSLFHVLITIYGVYTYVHDKHTSISISIHYTKIRYHNRCMSKSKGGRMGSTQSPLLHKSTLWNACYASSTSCVRRYISILLLFQYYTSCYHDERGEILWSFQPWWSNCSMAVTNIYSVSKCHIWNQALLNKEWTTYIHCPRQVGKPGHVG